MFLIVLLTIVLVLGIDFAIASFVVWLGSLLFPYTFSWLLAVFVWFVILILGGIFKSNKN